MADPRSPEEKGKSIPVPGYAIGCLVVIGAVWALFVALAATAIVLGSPSYDRHPSPDGRYVAIVGTRQCDIAPCDMLRAVWIARQDAGARDWHPLLRWQERTVSIRWEAGPRLVVDGGSGKPQTFTWQGVRIEVRDN